VYVPHRVIVSEIRELVAQASSRNHIRRGNALTKLNDEKILTLTNAIDWISGKKYSTFAASIANHPRNAIKTRKRIDQGAKVEFETSAKNLEVAID
jgi:hypothetical protein